MKKRSWEARQLFPLARRIAAILYQHPAINGVALAGSAARLENQVHDLDIVILHNDGQQWDGRASLPSRETSSGLFTMEWHQLNLLIEEVRGEVPVDIISINQRILTDCEYLHGENLAARDENFLKRLFCELPLQLLMPYSSKAEVYEYTKDQPPDVTNVQGFVPMLTKDLAHSCNKKECKPSVSWEERRKQREHSWRQWRNGY